MTNGQKVIEWKKEMHENFIHLGYFELFTSEARTILEHFGQAKSIRFIENKLTAYKTDLLSAKKECFQWKIHWYLTF